MWDCVTRVFCRFSVAGSFTSYSEELFDTNALNPKSQAISFNVSKAEYDTCYLMVKIMCKFTKPFLINNYFLIFSIPFSSKRMCKLSDSAEMSISLDVPELLEMGLSLEAKL